MPELFYPTKFTAKGPWLIESSQLLALDEAIDQYRDRTQEPAASVEQKNANSSGGNAVTRTITFLLRGDRELQTASFNEAIIHPAAANEVTLGMRYEVKMQGVTALLTLEERKHK